VVTDFKVHHDQSLAHWNMVDGNGTVLSTGASFGIYKNAQLTKMIGFFWEV
jgi:mannose-6-phosphate isomerase-like protein (cupin superfamily)